MQSANRGARELDLRGGVIYYPMPDTTSNISPYRRSLRRLLGAGMIFLASLLIAGSVGLAQEGDLDCDDFASQQEAQGYFESQGPGDPDRLDADGDGVPCEEPDAGNGDSEDDLAAPTSEGIQYSEDDDTVSGDQYDDQPAAPETPNTGGPALLPLAGALMLSVSGGYCLIRR